MKACYFSLCIILLLHLASSFDKAKKLHENKLRKSGYNKVIRPVSNASDHIDVRLGLKLSQLIDVVSIAIFNVRRSYCARYIAIGWMSVRPSVRLFVCSLRHTLVLCRNGSTYRQTVFTAW